MKYRSATISFFLLLFSPFTVVFSEGTNSNGFRANLSNLQGQSATSVSQGIGSFNIQGSQPPLPQFPFPSGIPGFPTQFIHPGNGVVVQAQWLEIAFRKVCGTVGVVMTATNIPGVKAAVSLLIHPDMTNSPPKEYQQPTVLQYYSHLPEDKGWKCGGIVTAVAEKGEETAVINVSALQTTVMNWLRGKVQYGHREIAFVTHELASAFPKFVTSDFDTKNGAFGMSGSPAEIPIGLGFNIGATQGTGRAANEDRTSFTALLLVRTARNWNGRPTLVASVNESLRWADQVSTGFMKSKLQDLGGTSTENGRKAQAATVIGGGQ